ncbi:MAG: SPFH domain-containing protein [Deltaproteobacteria bacterium]|nr:SPFH domain-containing protein [Deltaproteobacteria bacterium]
MALLEEIKRQLRSVIEWHDANPHALFYQWSDNGDEIKNASKLIVGPGQGCIFVYEGKIRTVLEDECLVQLETANIPFWTTISKFMQAFESEHKAGIYFFRKTKVLNQKWGTLSAIKYEDPKFKFPVGLKAFGNYSYRITDPRSFFVNVVGSHNVFSIEDFREIMADRIIPPLADFLAESRFSFTDIDANRNEIAQGMFLRLQADFGNLGSEITDFRIEGTDFDEETLKRINRIADMAAEAQAAAVVGLDFAAVQQVAAMRDAAKNEGGGAGLGLGLGAGMGMGQKMAQAMGDNFPSQPRENHPASNDPLEKLAQLKKMHEAALITDAEFVAKKKDILDNY